MVKRKLSTSAALTRIDHFRRTVAVRPLFGLERLVRFKQRKWSGVLFCDNVISVSDTVTFSERGAGTSSFTLGCQMEAPGFLGEPRLSVANEASRQEMERLFDDGRKFKFSFKPESGKTYSFACDVYGSLETHQGATRSIMFDGTWVGNHVLAVDLSAYVRSGFVVRTPLCEYEPAAANGGRGKHGQSRHPLAARELAEGFWEWHVDDVVDGAILALWLLEGQSSPREFDSAEFKKLSTELSINAGVAKDLHNFVSICNHYVADFRSLNAISHEMVVNRSVLIRSLDAVEQLIGREVIERTKGKGLIRVTPAGEAVLDWWSRFYMRWTFIAPNPVAARKGK